MVLGVFGVCALGLIGWLLGVATGPASGKAAKSSAAKVTVVTVTAGKPSELAFKLSKSSGLAAGPVTFKVTNAGKVTHDFKICTTAVTSSAANTCVGKVTKMLKHGQSATLTVTLSKSGKYEFLCTVPGHAGAGMKGLLGLGVTVATPTPVASSGTKTPTTTTAAGAGSSGAACASPQSTTVSVSEFEYGFTVSPSSVHCGTITFNQTNTGNIGHDFVLQGLPGNAGHGSTINGGASTTMTVTMASGVYSYQCDIADHAELGMMGNFTVN